MEMAADVVVLSDSDSDTAGKVIVCYHNPWMTYMYAY